jgi:hypothetical protein
VSFASPRPDDGARDSLRNVGHELHFHWIMVREDLTGKKQRRVKTTTCDIKLPINWRKCVTISTGVGSRKRLIFLCEVVRQCHFDIML